MNYRLLLKLHSIILVVLACAFALSSGAAYLWDPSYKSTARNAFILCTFLCLSLALVFHLFGKESGNRLFRKEALALVGTGWILASFIGAIPYLFILPDRSFADALFESVSGFTTTGATVLGDIESLPPSLLFWRSMTQFVGGLGVVVFFVAILSFLGAGAKILFSRESSGTSTELNTSRVQKGVWGIAALYGGLSIFCLIAYRFGGMSWFDAVNHMFTTVSTGGYSTKNDSFAAFTSPLLQWACIVFMCLGGTTFVLMLRVLRGDFKALWCATEVKAFYAILVGATALVTLYLMLSGWTDHFHTAVRSAAFQVVSIMTTTGYVTEDYGVWAVPAETILLILMLVGGCSGSTSGGTKVIRFVIGWRICMQHVERAFRANVVRPVMVNGKPLDRENQEGVLVFIVLIWMLTIVSFFVVAILEPRLSLLGNLSAVLATLYNIGPAFAELGPTENFGHLASQTKLYLSLLMVMGRLELFAILVLFAPALWRKY